MWKHKLVIVILVVSIFCLATSDSKASIADMNIPNNELTSSVTEADNLSDNATITITWTTAPLPDE